jgi:hypothetical protein
VHGQATSKHEFTRFTTAQTWEKPPPSPFILLSMPSHKAITQMSFCLRTPKLNPEILEIGTFATLEAHNFVCKPPIEMRSKAKL